MGGLLDRRGKIRPMVHSVKRLPHDYEDLSLIPRTHVKKRGMVACPYVSALES